MNFSVSDVNKILGNIKNRESLTNQFQTFNNISLDTRTILKNDLFIAIKGMNFDGHIFGLLVIVLAAAEAAVALAIVINIYNNMNSINVDDASELSR